MWFSVALWLLLVGLLAAVGVRALDACGIVLPGGAVLRFCPPPVEAAPVGVELDREFARQETLRRRLDALRLALVGAPDCPPPLVAEAPPQPPPDPAPPPEVPEPVEVAEAPPFEPPVPNIRPDPPPPPPEPPPTPPEDIPQEAWQDQDIGFLEGCWTLISPLRMNEVSTGRSIGVRQWQICFDQQGNGFQTVTMENGMTCSGPIGGNFLPNGNLRLEDRADLPCAGTSMRIFRIVNECRRLPDGTARCIGGQPGRGVQGVPSTFRR